MLHNYFINNNKVIITDVDTRAVVRHIRDKGTMNAIISNDDTDVSHLSKNLLDVYKTRYLEYRRLWLDQPKECIEKGIYARFRLGIRHNRLYNRDDRSSFDLNNDEKYHLANVLDYLIVNC